MASSPHHPDGRAARPSARSHRAAVAALAAAAVVLPVTAGLGPARATITPAPVAVPAVTLPAGIEAFSPYLPQVSCDPVAKPGVKAFTVLVAATWAHGTNGGIARACSDGGESEHKEGRAWDWMLDPASYGDVVAGSRVISWLLANDAVNARRLGIMYVIWNQRVWSTYRRAEGWRPYSGSDPHTSHIHFSFSWAGAMKRTSWWTGKVAPTEYGPCVAVVGQLAPAYGSTVNLVPCPPPLPLTTGAAGGGFLPPPAP